MTEGRLGHSLLPSRLAAPRRCYRTFAANFLPDLKRAVSRTLLLCRSAPRHESKGVRVTKVTRVTGFSLESSIAAYHRKVNSEAVGQVEQVLFDLSRGNDDRRVIKHVRAFGDCSSEVAASSPSLSSRYRRVDYVDFEAHTHMRTAHSTLNKAPCLTLRCALKSTHNSYSAAPWLTSLKSGLARL